VTGNPVETERTSLPTHVDLCELRYRSLENRMRRVEYSFYALVALMIFGRDHLIDVLKLLAPHIVAMALFAGAACAQPPADADPALAPWFQSLTDRLGRSCCSISDCRHLPTRVGPDGYEVFAGGAWIEVPPDKVLPRRDNPTGEPVTCWSPSRGIMCFIEGTGT
jgi:hypothetical protein